MITGRNFNIKKLFRETPVTAILILLNVLVYVIQMILNMFDISLYQLGAIEKVLVMEYGEYYRIITGAFLHGGLFHLLSNTFFGLYILTSVFERMMGSSKTLLLYVLTLLVSGFLVVAFTPAGIGSVGASGAIFGILGALFYLSLFRKDLMPVQAGKQIRSLILMNMVFTLLIPSISVPAHLGGLVSGFLLSFLIIPRDKSEYEIYS